MFQGKRTRISLAFVLFFALIFSSLAGTSSLSLASTKKSTIKKAYKQYVQQLQEESKTELCYAIINASKERMPVLLVAEANSWQSSKEQWQISADVYSYSSGKVIYITKMTSTGSSYPLLKKGSYILSGWHHSSQRLMVSNAKGYLESVEGFGSDSQCYKKSWTVVNGKKKKRSSKKISQKKANSLDYYLNAYSDNNIIQFKEVKS